MKIRALDDAPQVGSRGGHRSEFLSFLAEDTGSTNDVVNPNGFLLIDCQHIAKQSLESRDARVRSNDLL